MRSGVGEVSGTGTGIVTDVSVDGRLLTDISSLDAVVYWYVTVLLVHPDSYQHSTSALVRESEDAVLLDAQLDLVTGVGQLPHRGVDLVAQAAQARQTVILHRLRQRRLT
jgi:hypothetical protein